jgi:hypothetical protein
VVVTTTELDVELTAVEVDAAVVELVDVDSEVVGADVVFPEPQPPTSRTPVDTASAADHFANPGLKAKVEIIPSDPGWPSVTPKTPEPARPAPR